METFTSQKFNENLITKESYISMFEEFGFTPSKVEISFVNGCSAYITLNVNVINENKMYAETFVFDGKATITVRVSDHVSGLEKNCGGICGNRFSLVVFRELVKNNIISA